MDKFSKEVRAYQKRHGLFPFDRSVKGDALIMKETTQSTSMEKKSFNYKPFDLEAAKAGKPIMCRDGRKVRYLGVLSTNTTNYVVVFAREDMDGNEIVTTRPTNGSVVSSERSNSDVVMVPEKKSVWVCLYRYKLYPDNVPFRVSASFTTEEACKKAWEDIVNYTVLGYREITIED